MTEKISKANQIKIDRLKVNLRKLRKLAGWSAEVLGEKLGVYKQTICNLEGDNSTLSLIQYIAIRSVFDVEVINHPEKRAFARAIPLLLDENSSIDGIARKRIEQKVDQIANAASSGVDQQTLDTLFSVLLPNSNESIKSTSSTMVSEWMMKI